MPTFLNSFLSRTSWRQRLVFWSGAILIGALIAAMTLLSEWAAQTYRDLSNLYIWFNFIIPPFGLSLTAWLTFRFFPGSEGSGIPQVKTALEVPFSLNDRIQLVSLRIAIGKIFLPIMGLLSGASVGFGGPATHVGASLMVSVGKLANFPVHYMSKGLLLAGSAAGFAAMFTAPLAGIMFAIEEMGRTLEERISSLVLSAIIFSGITAYSILHHTIYFAENTLSLPFGKAWLAIPLCGVAGGVLGALFSFIIVNGKRQLRKLKFSIVPTAFICGCSISLLGYLSAGTSFGTGYQLAKDVILSAAPIDPLFPIYKMLATCATFLAVFPVVFLFPPLQLVLVLALILPIGFLLHLST